MGFTIIPSGQAKLAEAVVFVGKAVAIGYVLSDGDSSAVYRVALSLGIVYIDKAISAFNRLAEGVTHDKGLNDSELEQRASQTPTPPNTGMR